jgi:hypothetical protein
MTVVGLALAAAAGAMVRFRLSPYGWRATLVVNVVGSFVLGVLLATRGSTSDVVMVLGTGFCGSRRAPARRACGSSLSARTSSAVSLPPRSASHSGEPRAGH